MDEIAQSDLDTVELVRRELTTALTEYTNRRG